MRDVLIVQIQPPSDVLFEGTLDTTLLTTDPNATVVPTKAIYGGLPTDATITAANDFQTSGSYGQLVLVAEDILGNYFLIPTASQPLPILFWTTLADDLADVRFRRRLRCRRDTDFRHDGQCEFHRANTSA